MFHHLSGSPPVHRYTKEMPFNQRVARHALDIANHIACCHSRHDARVAQRVALGLPPRYADKLALQQARDAERKPKERAVELALQTHDGALALVPSGDVDVERLQAVAEGAMRQLADQGFISDDALRVFREAVPGYVLSSHAARPAVLPAHPHLAQTLCRAAIGQAFIDEGIFVPEGASARIAITPDAVDAWFYF
jgi:hypothetical protein